MKRLLSGLRFLDRHVVVGLIALWALVVVGLLTWSRLQAEPILLAAAQARDRAQIFGLLTSTGIAVAALAFTVLAIITALPSSERVCELRSRNGWPLLERTLLLSALGGLSTTAGGIVSTGVDNGARGREWLEALLLASAVTTLVSILVGGLAFALLLASIREHPPALRVPPGRGQGTA